MAGFKATEAVSALTYDFRGFAVADEDAAELLKEAHGTTPEPSVEQFRRLQAAQRELLGLQPGASQEEVNASLAGMSVDEMREMDEEMLDIVADVTSGAPSRDELAALPFRIRQRYYGFLFGELDSPTTGTAPPARRSLEQLDLFLVRLHLGFSIDEWRALPWWQTQLYRERLHEFLTGQEPEVVEVAPERGDVIDQVPDPVTDDGVPTVSLRDLGARIIPVQFG
jgi:hypothetical protein